MSRIEKPDADKPSLVRLTGTGRMRGMHPKCAPSIPGGPQIVAAASAGSGGPQVPVCWMPRQVPAEAQGGRSFTPRAAAARALEA
jgi:hypothetical protein